MSMPEPSDQYGSQIEPLSVAEKLSRRLELAMIKWRGKYAPNSVLQHNEHNFRLVNQHLTQNYPDFGVFHAWGDVEYDPSVCRIHMSRMVFDATLTALFYEQIAQRVTTVACAMLPEVEQLQGPWNSQMCKQLEQQFDRHMLRDTPYVIQESALGLEFSDAKSLWGWLNTIAHQEFFYCGARQEYSKNYESCMLAMRQEFIDYCQAYVNQKAGNAKSNAITNIIAQHATGPRDVGLSHKIDSPYLTPNYRMFTRKLSNELRSDGYKVGHHGLFRLAESYLAAGYPEFSSRYGANGAYAYAPANDKESFTHENCQIGKMAREYGTILTLYHGLGSHLEMIAQQVFQKEVEAKIKYSKAPLSPTELQELKQAFWDACEMPRYSFRSDAYVVKKELGSASKEQLINQPQFVDHPATFGVYGLGDWIDAIAKRAIPYQRRSELLALRNDIPTIIEKAANHFVDYCAEQSRNAHRDRDSGFAR